MRSLCIALLTLAAPLPALAETSLSSEIASTGLAATEARLLTVKAPTNADTFALGGVRFLRTIEKALQKAHADGLYDPTGLVPVLRLAAPADAGSDQPADGKPPFRPEAVRELFADVVTNLDRAREPLALLKEDADFGLTVDLSDIWFDINSDDKRDPGEGLTEIVGALSGSAAAPGAKGPVVRFDTADAAWLSAYCRMLQGVADVVLAYDPTEAIAINHQTGLDMAAFGLSSAPVLGLPNEGAALDTLATIRKALLHKPDANRARAAQIQFLAMIEENRRFWTLVAKETDNDHEWLPNDHQQSALGIDFPQGTGAAWLATLADLERVLKGERLIPHWRIADGAGVNVARMFTDPRPIDLVDWIQGAGAIPYLETGTLADMNTLRTFDALVGGRVMLFSLYLN